jgi:hypothetical protein
MNQLDQLYSDFLHFSKLHSWYKKLDFNGTVFYFYQDYGLLPRGFNEMTDKENLHWHFSIEKPENKKYYVTKFGPFLRGEAHFHIIESDNKLIFKKWFQNNYPELFHDYYVLNYLNYFENYEVEKKVAELERDKYWEFTKNAYIKEIGSEKFTITI